MQRLSRHLPKLGTKQRGVGEFVLRHPELAMIESASAIAARLEVAPSTVVRFAQAFDYSGFPEFQKALHSMFYQQLSTVQRLGMLPGNNDGLSQYVERVYANNADRLQVGFHRLSTDSLRTAVDLLTQSNTVYAMGFFGGVGIAHWFSYSLGLIRPRVRLVNTTVTAVDQVYWAGPSDTIVALHFPRYNRVATELAEFAAQKGVPLILITDGMWAPGATTAAAVLEVPVNSDTYTHSHCATMCLLDALLASCALKHRTQSQEGLGKLEDVLAQWNPFV